MSAFKHIIFILLMLFITINSYANNDLQIKAEKAYSEKNYKEAILAYDSILSEGLSSYKLYYNLGNAYYKNNELGKAIYNYEMAKKIQPNNKDVKINLAIANEKIIDKIESKENFFIGAIKTKLVNTLSSNGWAWLSVNALIASLILAFAYFISKNVIVKRFGFFLSALSIIIFIISMVFGYASLDDKDQNDFAIIINREAKVLDDPATTSSTKFVLHEGTKVSVLETNSEWTNIKLENGNEGWIKTSQIGLF